MRSAAKGVLEGFRKSFTVTGRTPRAEFWWFFALHSVGSVVLGLAALILGEPVLFLAAILLFLVTLPGVICAIIRRRHDVGRSGILVALAYVACLVVTVGALLALINTAVTFATEQSITAGAAQDIDVNPEQRGSFWIFSSPMFLTSGIVDVVLGGALVGSLAMALLSLLGIPLLIVFALVAIALGRASQPGPNKYGPNPHEVTP